MHPVRAEPHPCVPNPMARYEVQPRPVAASLVHATEAGPTPSPEAGVDKPDAAEATEEPGPPVIPHRPARSRATTLPHHLFRARVTPPVVGAARLPPSAISTTSRRRSKRCCSWLSSSRRSARTPAMPMMLIAFGNAFRQGIAVLCFFFRPVALTDLVACSDPIARTFPKPRLSILGKSSCRLLTSSCFSGPSSLSASSFRRERSKRQPVGPPQQ